MSGEHKAISALSVGAEMLYNRILNASDGLCNFYGAGGEISARLMKDRIKNETVSTDDVFIWLDELEESGLIERYEVKGKMYLNVRYGCVSSEKEIKFPVPPFINGDPKSKAADELNECADTVIDYMNEMLELNGISSRFRHAEGNRSHIRARISPDGFSLGELKLVVSYKSADWLKDTRMANYFRPSTLFNPNKFAGYLTAARIWENRGKRMSLGDKSIYKGDRSTDDYGSVVK